MKKTFIRNFLLLMFSLAYALLPAQNQIVGTVLYHDNESNPVYNVNIDLHDDANNIVASTVSDINGEFEFNNVPNGIFTIKGSANLPVGNINLVDASMILQYLLGLRTFNDYEFDAADVNDSGNVTFGDYILVLVGYLLQGNPFPTDEWQFEQNSVNFTGRDDNKTDTTKMYATSTGDVEGIWMPTGRSLNLSNTENVETVITEEVTEIVITSDYDNEISGYHIDMVYPNNYIEIVDIVGIDENIHYEIDEDQGIIKVAWLDETPKEKVRGNNLFTIKVRAINNFESDISQAITLYNNSTILDSESNIIEDVTIILPQITTEISNISINNFELNVVSYPNPAISNINIKITSPYEDVATIFIYDISGKLVNTIENNAISKGEQIINTNIESFPNGTYLYMIDFNKNNTIKGRFNKAN